MNLPSDTAYKSCNPADHLLPAKCQANENVNADTTRMHVYQRIFEKKVFCAESKKLPGARIPERNAPFDPESDRLWTDSIASACLPFGSLPQALLSCKAATVLFRPAFGPDNSIMPSFCRQPNDAGADGTSNGTVITFTFLSSLEAHVEYCGDIIRINWFAKTFESYQFVKNNITKLRRFLQRRLRKKLSISARYLKKPNE